MRDTRPEEWADAVAFDHAIRHGPARAVASGHLLWGRMYLHRARLPLDQAAIDAPPKAAPAADPDQVAEVHVLAFEESLPDDAALNGCSPYSCRAAGCPHATTSSDHGGHDEQRLITELEEAGLIADPDLRQEFRARIQIRFAELNHQQRSLTEQREALPQPGPHTGHPQTPELLDRLPRLTARLDAAPGDLRRNLYDAYRLQVRYNRQGTKPPSASPSPPTPSPY